MEMTTLQELKNQQDHFDFLKKDEERLAKEAQIKASVYMYARDQTALLIHRIEEEEKKKKENKINELQDDVDKVLDRPIVIHTH